MTSSCNVKKKKRKIYRTFNGKQKNIYMYIDKIFKKFKENEKEYVL